MKSFLRLWNNVWFAPCDPLPAAVCRIAFGTLLLVSFTGMSQNWERFFAVDGCLSLCDTDLDPRRVRYGWNVFDWTEGIVPTVAWWYVGYASILALVFGFQTRLATVCTYVMMCSIVHRNPVVVNGEDLISRFILLYGMFSPWGHALSVDEWLRKRRQPLTVRPPGTVWAVRMMQVHVMLIYVISLPYKFAQDIGWLTGDAMHWTVAGDMWWMRDFLPELTLSCNGWIRRCMTWGTVVVEGLVPLGVCFRRTRLVSVFAMMSLHLGIAALVPGVTLFTLSMVAAAAIYIEPGYYRAFAAALVRWCSTGESLSKVAAPLVFPSSAPIANH